MMRLPPITTLLSLVTLFSLTSNRAIASDKTESVTAEKEESLTPQLNSDNSIFSQPDKIKSKQEQKQKNKSFLCLKFLFL